MNNPRSPSSMPYRSQFMRPCYFYNVSQCRNGVNCPFAHVFCPYVRFIRPKSKTYVYDQPTRIALPVQETTHTREIHVHGQRCSLVDRAIDNLQQSANDIVGSNGWVTTCVGVATVKGNFEDLHNISPEETRFYYNEALQNNNLEQFKSVFEEITESSSACLTTFAEMDDKTRENIKLWMMHCDPADYGDLNNVEIYVPTQVYSTEQTEEDRQAYDCERFEGRIPLQPPTKEQCRN
ncbi:hypothetical protein ACOME3_000173 [Neoechinorhynchus agilis]